MLDQGRFAHHRLDAYHRALEMAVLADKLSKQVPRGYGHLLDQLRRAASATPLLIAEGANRTTPAQKRQRFVEARGECGEAAAAVELLHALGRLPVADFERFTAKADRIAAMLTGLIKRFG